MKRVWLGMMTAASMIGVSNAAKTEGAPMKTLVVYYSFSGNTEQAAKALGEALPGDVAALEDVTKPTREACYGAGKEACREGKSWPIKPLGKAVADYDRVFVGCPVWFGLPTPQFNAFIEQTDFAGKQVVVFVTLGGGSPDNAIKTMTQRIEAKGGKVVGSFYIRTKNVPREEIAKQAKALAAPYVQAPSP